MEVGMSWQGWTYPPNLWLKDGRTSKVTSSQARLCLNHPMSSLTLSSPGWERSRESSGTFGTEFLRKVSISQQRLFLLPMDSGGQFWRMGGKTGWNINWKLILVSSWSGVIGSLKGDKVDVGVCSFYWTPGRSKVVFCTRISFFLLFFLKCFFL